MFSASHAFSLHAIKALPFDIVNDVVVKEPQCSQYYTREPAILFAFYPNLRLPEAEILICAFAQNRSSLTSNFSAVEDVSSTTRIKTNLI